MAASMRLSIAGPPRGTIVAIEPLKSDPQRVRVMVRIADRSRSRCMSVILRDQLKSLRLRVGGTWSQRVADRVEALAEVDSARDSALRMIAAARRTPPSAALAARLQRLGHSARAARAAVRQLRSDGWISDSIDAS